MDSYNLQPQASASTQNSNPQTIGSGTGLQPQSSSLQTGASDSQSKLLTGKSTVTSLKVVQPEHAVMASTTQQPATSKPQPQSTNLGLYAGIALVAVAFMAILTYSLFRERP